MTFRSNRYAPSKPNFTSMLTPANPGLLRAIMEKKVLDDDLKAEMTKVIKEAKETIRGRRQAVSAR